MGCVPNEHLRAPMHASLGGSCFLIPGPELKIHRGLSLELVRLDQPLPSYLLKPDFPLKLPF